jgi:adenylosuccinate lyase
MNISLSPLDDRYSETTKELKKYFSEYALFKYRMRVELKYFIKLVELNLEELDGININQIRKIFKLIYRNYNNKAYKKIKDYEKVTKHDVKALEYYLRDVFDKYELSRYKSFIHFGLTSQDINNTANSLQLKDCIQKNYIKKLNTIIEKINFYSTNFADVIMISRTHGQPAVPTTMGKEFKVFSYRLGIQLEQLMSMKYYGKFGGASGNLNAHKYAYPEIDWEKFGNELIESMNLERSLHTTQIDSYDSFATIFDCLKRINNILVDMCQDIWLYVSMDYLKQKIIEGEVGSSTMPHKVNPINFENAEGNLKLANSLLEFFSSKLPISRLQRDLTDSTVLRNVGVIFGHIFVAFDNIMKGLNKIDINLDKIDEDLENNFVVVTEGIQTLLRRYGYEDAYEKLKDFSRNNKAITQVDIKNFVESLEIDNFIKEKLKNIHVLDYI